ncbi:MAG: hypothetical protein ACT4P5_18665 [Armatimonadota bacterium]
MDRSLLLGALALGSLGWLIGFLLTRSGPGERGPGIAPAFPLAAGGLLVLVAAVSVPGRALWPAAQGWGQGVVIGGLAALLAGWVLTALRSDLETFRGTAAVTAPAFLAVAAVAAAFLWMRPTIIDTLAGIAGGWLLIGLMTYLGLGSTEGRDTGKQSTGWPVQSAAVIAGIGFAVTLCAVAALGHYRDLAGPQTARWGGAAIALAAGVPFMILLTGRLGSPGSRAAGGRTRASGDPGTPSAFRFGWRVLLAAALLAGLAQMLSARVLGQPRFLLALGAGLIMGLVLWWLAADPEGGQAALGSAIGSDTPSVRHVVSVLMAVGAVVAAFYLLTGYGIGVMLLGGWLVAGAMLPRAGSLLHRLAPMLFLGIILLLYRLFTQRFQDDLGGAALTDHFAIFTILAGAFVPILLTRLLSSGADPPSPAAQLTRLALIIVIAAAVPAALLVLWGARAALGLLAGLALATAIYPQVRLSALLALAVALPLVQWAHHFLLAAALTREERIRILLWLLAIVVIAIAVADYGGRVVGWLRRRGGPPVARESQHPESREGAKP